MFSFILLSFGFLLMKGVATSRRCQVSSDFQRQCGEHKNWYGLTPEQCRAKCEEDSNCLIAQWHPPYQVWGDEDRTVCFTFKRDNPNLKRCDTHWRQEDNVGAKLIRCSEIENIEIERCWLSDDFQRHCGTALRYVYGQSVERCRQTCNDLKNCYVAHWHPPCGIWDDEKRSVCFLFPVGTAVCEWHGAELIGSNPGAHIIRCREGIRKFEEDDDDGDD